MHRLEYLIVKFLFFLFRNISFKTGKRIAWSFYFLVAKVFRYRRNVILSNLRLVYGNQLPMPKSELLKGIYKNFVSLWMEFLQIERLTSQNIENHFTVHGAEVVDKALSKGKGLIFMSGHYGNFEWLGKYFVHKGYKVSGIAKRQSNHLVNDLIEKNRKSYGAGVIYTKNAMEDGLEALRKNEIVAIVADQDARKRGIIIDFLGQPSSTAVGPAVFHFRSGAPVCFVIAVRKDYGQFDVYVEEVEFADPKDVSDAAILDITEKHTRVLEKWIRKYPDQWFWMHKRWKTNTEKLKK